MIPRLCLAGPSAGEPCQEFAEDPPLQPGSFDPMNEQQRKRRPCAACGKHVGLATIVAGGPYPEAPLCLDCGTRRDLDEVYADIKKRQESDRA